MGIKSRPSTTISGELTGHSVITVRDKTVLVIGTSLAVRAVFQGRKAAEMIG